MKMAFVTVAFATALASTAASAAQLDKLQGLMGGSGGSLTSGSASNAAGILQYCMTNNYLGGDTGAAGVKDQLLGSLGTDHQAASNDANTSSASKLLGRFGGKKGQAAPAQAPSTQDTGYLDGARGLLKSGDGKTLDLGGGQNAQAGTGDLKAQLTRKVCDAVLKQGQKMVGMGK